MTSAGRRILGASVGGLAVEAAMVVFAVLVALGVEEWREERQLQQFADRVEAAVVAELEANLEEMRTTSSGLRATQDQLARVLEAEDLSLLDGTVLLTLPDFSSAAWRAAQASQAAPYLDYEWVLSVSRAYEAHAVYARIGDRIIDAMGVIIAAPPTLESLRGVQGRLVILNGVHDQLVERLEALLAEPESTGGPDGSAPSEP